MAIESADYISQLDFTNPNGGDQRATADDHLRLTKKALQQSFPNVNSEVSASSGELNHLVGLTGNIQAALDDISAGYRSAIAVTSANLDAKVDALSSHLSTTSADLDAKIETLSAALSTTSATLQAAIDAGGGSAAAAVATLSATLNTKINTEISDRQTTSASLDAKIETLSAALSTTSSALDTKIESLSSNLDTKIETLTTALSTTSGNLDTKIEALSANLDTKIETEISNRQTTSANLDAKIEALSANLDTKIEGIVTRGSNANGEYVRFSDGTQICTFIGVAAAANLSTGAVFNSLTQTWTFPAAFTSTPTVSGEGAQIGRWVNAYGVSTTQASVVHWAAVSSAASVSASLMAIGRWA